MPPRSTDEIRNAYLEFFREHGHAVIPGASLVPENDPTVLFTTAGMHPLVPYLLGESHPAGRRLADCQICVRTQDIDEVGDASHLTFFEMLGNWSLGDYFKEGAIKLSYEFLTEVLEIPEDKLAVSCFKGDKDAPRDNESFKHWASLGIPEERIGFLGKEANWWGPAGRTGPCGPDTEMFYWVGDPTSSDGLRGAGGEPHGNPETCPEGWLEIWNDVFMEYFKNEDGTFEKLKQQNVDTGMGLERVAQVMQGVNSVYETDRMKPILDKVTTLSGSSKLEARSSKISRHARVIVDHLRAATFIIADGVIPSNVDQGYVLRKLLRRAIRSARQLGIEESPFTPQVARVVRDQYGHVYPKLRERFEGMQVALSNEEEKFGATLKEGLKHFERIVARLSGTTIAGLDAFHLYDTYGFPLELTREMAKEKTLKIDEGGFRRAFEGHQELSRAGGEQRFAGGLADHTAETTKLHTATHLLNAALRKVLGNRIFQKGSNITAERLRFDFSHSEKMTKEQIQKVEKLVNEAIERDLPVSYTLMTVEEAKKAGAIGVFEEKYASIALGTGGEKVKVYKMGGFSLEICGGPHVARTGMLGKFKILKEESSSAGVRRIRAVVEGGPKEIGVAQEAS
jgi:alanyl-tRNA synthetase